MKDALSSLFSLENKAFIQQWCSSE